MDFVLKPDYQIIIDSLWHNLHKKNYKILES